MDCVGGRAGPSPSGASDGEFLGTLGEGESPESGLVRGHRRKRPCFPSVSKLFDYCKDRVLSSLKIR